MERRDRGGGGGYLPLAGLWGFCLRDTLLISVHFRAYQSARPPPSLYHLLSPLSLLSASHYTIYIYIHPIISFCYLCRVIIAFSFIFSELQLLTKQYSSQFANTLTMWVTRRGLRAALSSIWGCFRILFVFVHIFSHIQAISAPSSVGLKRLFD